MNFELKSGKTTEAFAQKDKKVSAAKQRILDSFAVLDNKGLTLRKELLSMKWQDVIALVVEDCRDETIKARRREILEQIDPEEFLKDLNDHARSQLHSFSALRGLIFEALVLREFNEDEENSLLADFLLRAMRKPRILGVEEKFDRKQPDHLVVIIDRERGIAYITGMMEVKVTYTRGKRFKDQLENFYGNLENVIDIINEKMAELKEKYGTEFLPENGVKLLPFDEMKTMLIRPLSLKEHLYFESKATKDGWEYRRSAIGQRNAEWITAFMMNLARERGLVTNVQERQMKLS